MELTDSHLYINKYLFDKKYIREIESDDFSNNYPVIYILFDLTSRKAYVGESTNAFRRMHNHLINTQKKILKYVYIISNPIFNKSATLDIESNLIKYMSSDGGFTLLNGNAGLSGHNYYKRNLYFEIFEEIWDKLKLEKVVTKDILDIDNSDLFKFSPYKSLSKDQDFAILHYLSILNVNDKSMVFVEGSAGTGKTVLAIYLIKLLLTDFDIDDLDNSNEEMLEKLNLVNSIKNSHGILSIGLVIPMVSLRKTLRNVFKSINGLSAGMVIGPSDVVKKHYDLLIVDEAHRLKRRVGITNYGSFDNTNKKLGLDNNGTELDWIIHNSKHQIFFYDQAQSIRPSDVPQDQYLKLKSSSYIIKLTSQMRVSSGNDYIKFVHSLLNPNSHSNVLTIKDHNYDLKLFDYLPNMIKELEEKESKHGLCRLMAGYSWEWISRKNGKPDAIIDGVELFWNKVAHDWINSTTQINEMGCIHTTQGYDLNYGGVIFGKEIVFNPQTSRIEIIKSKYFDAKGKSGIDEIALHNYIINIYKTLLYRGIKGTYIYVCDKNLREYFGKHINIKRKEEPFKILPFNKVKPYINSVPIYDISVAAGLFSELQQSSNHEWIELPEAYKPQNNYFVCKVVGESMNRRIPNNSWCLFRKDTGGTRDGKIVLVEHYNIQDSDYGAGYTIKSYQSKKETNQDSWHHQEIILKPLSFDDSFENIVLKQDEIIELNVVGIFVGVL